MRERLGNFRQRYREIAWQKFRNGSELHTSRLLDVRNGWGRDDLDIYQWKFSQVWGAAKGVFTAFNKHQQEVSTTNHEQISGPCKFSSWPAMLSVSMTKGLAQ